MIIGILLLSFLMGQPVWAAVQNGEKYDIATNEISGWPKGPEIYSETGVLMEAETGTVLYDSGKDETRYPASITKVMTTLLALENSSLDEEVTFTQTGLERIYEGTNINMQVGEVLTMEQCLYAVMIKSANEVAAQVAEHVGGTQEKFVEMMNERAQELGCTNTNFANPSGLPDENHWTTANDMALIFREALKNEEFVKIIGTLSYTIEPTNMNPEPRTLTSHHALLVPSAPEHYDGCIGGKTGVTEAAKNTLVTAAKRDGMTLIAVVMRADPGQVCADTTALFDYGFSQFEMTPVEGGEVPVPKGRHRGRSGCDGSGRRGRHDAHLFLRRLYGGYDGCVGGGAQAAGGRKTETGPGREGGSRPGRAGTKRRCQNSEGAGDDRSLPDDYPRDGRPDPCPFDCNRDPGHL